MPVLDSNWQAYNDFLSEFFLRHPNLPDHLQTTGIALLTILIPLAIASLSEILNNKNSNKVELGKLDLHVILDRVFKIKKLIIYTALIFIPTTIFGLFNGVISLLLLALSVSGIILVVKIILTTYRWIKGNAYLARSSYLTQLEETEDLKVVWESVWTSTNNYYRFYEIFADTMDKLLSPYDVNSLHAFLHMIQVFNLNLGKRHLLSIFIYHDLFKLVLKWHYLATVELKEKVSMGGIKRRAAFSQIKTELEKTISLVAERSFVDNDGYWHFFDIFEHEIDSRISDSRYIEQIMNVFYKSFFQGIEENRYHYLMWDNAFPNNWLVRRSQLLSQDNPFAGIALNEFVKWMRSRLRSHELSKTPDLLLEEVSSNLFPEVNNADWAVVLIFYATCGHEPNARCKSVVEKFWSFGFGTTPTLHDIPEKDGVNEVFKRARADLRNRRKATFELVYSLPQLQLFFSEQNLVADIDELETLDIYEEKSLEAAHRFKLLTLCRDMLAYLRGIY
ncbi:hypothetical protein KJ632_00355 [Patescibacteria group bacterium]|nr:hypothetical protein [Patescibacteria group bacterium]